MTAPTHGIGRKNGLGVAALVLAILSLLFSWSVVGGIIGGVVAVVLGLLGRGRATRSEADNGGVAVAGIALGALAVVVSIAFAVIWWNAWHDVGGSDYMDCVVRAGNDQKAQEACTNKWLDNVQTKFSITPATPTPGST